MRTFFKAIALAPGLFVSPVDRAVDPAKMPVHAVTAIPVEVAPPPRRIWDYFNHGLVGYVTALDRDSITVQHLSGYIMDSADVRDHVEFQGRQRKCVSISKSGKPFVLMCPDRPDMLAIRLEASREVYKVTAPDGTVTTIRRIDETPKRFEVDEWLAGGGFDPGLRHTDVYPLSAVKVGDLVRLRITHFEPYGRREGATISDNRYNICVGISIQRRPGGKVPPSWGENPDELPQVVRARFERNRHHVRMQILQDWEEKGVPLPYSYHPGGQWPQLAPPPREVKR